MAEPAGSCPDPLLGEGDPAPFELVRPAARSAWLLTCDHAGRAIPRRLKGLGLSEAELNSHVAWDPGVAELGRRLSARLDATLMLQPYSRLVIDANRPPGASDSIPVLSERTRIPANAGLSAEQIRQRVEAVFLPYHRRLAALIDQRLALGQPTILVALHSFTPVYLGVVRPWHAGVLHGRDGRLGRLMLHELRRDPALVVGDNQPYAASEATDHTIIVHGEQRALLHVELEVRQDLLADQEGQGAWSERLGQALEACLG